MDCESLHFHQRGTNPELGLKIRGYWVAKTTFELTETLIKQNLHLLTWETPLESRDICRHQDWDSWRVSLRHNIGRCVRHFSEQGTLPLRIVNPNKGGPRRYMRK